MRTFEIFQILKVEKINDVVAARIQYGYGQGTIYGKGQIGNLLIENVGRTARVYTDKFKYDQKGRAFVEDLQILN